jgi:hypothetical protein
MTRPPLHVIWQPDPSLRTRSGRVEPREFEWICSLLSSFEAHHHVDGAFRQVAPHPLVVIEGFQQDPTEIARYLRRLKEGRQRVGLIHIGDEHSTADVSFYREADLVYRNYWRPVIDRLPHCHYLPLGVNCPLGLFTKPPVEERPHRWSFAGQAKLSRRTLIDVAATLPEGRLVVNEKFNSGLDKAAYAALLRDTQIVLCPRGWSSVESYRLYEALEAGAIPLVEDDGGWGLLHEHRRPCAWVRAVSGGPRYWIDLARRGVGPGSYWQNAYGPDFPCPRIYRWENLPAVLDRIDVEAASHATQTWWHAYKKVLRERLHQQLAATLLNADASPHPA